MDCLNVSLNDYEFLEKCLYIFHTKCKTQLRKDYDDAGCCCYLSSNLCI